MWPGGLVGGLLFQGGVIDDSPALQFLRDTLAQFPEGYKRRVSLAAADVNTGEYVIFDQENTSWDDLSQAALSSGSIPGVFPPQHFAGRVLMDGGTIWDVNIDSAVQQCLGIVDNLEDITIDVAICGYSDITEHEEASKRAINNYLRSWDIKRYFSGMNAIYQEMQAYPEVNYRYLF
jgi:predicted acylesterase/phospholipase RssA